jgi:dihydroorotase
MARRHWQMPQAFAFGEGSLTPLRAGQTLPWKLQ